MTSPSVISSGQKGAQRRLKGVKQISTPLKAPLHNSIPANMLLFEANVVFGKFWEYLFASWKKVEKKDISLVYTHKTVTLGRMLKGTAVRLLLLHSTTKDVLSSKSVKQLQTPCLPQASLPINMRNNKEINKR